MKRVFLCSIQIFTHRTLYVQFRLFIFSSYIVQVNLHLIFYIFRTREMQVLVQATFQISLIRVTRNDTDEERTTCSYVHRGAGPSATNTSKHASEIWRSVTHNMNILVKPHLRVSCRSSDGPFSLGPTDKHKFLCIPQYHDVFPTA
jgi:hypothetical protein